MSSASVKIVLSGLKPREINNLKIQNKKVIDSYVPKASGVGIVDRIKSTYPENIVRKNVL